METTGRVAKRPFHETIVDEVRNAGTVEEMMVLVRLIKATSIPKGHDEIIEAWRLRCQAMGWSPLNVTESLLEQKQEAADKEKAKAKERERAGATSS